MDHSNNAGGGGKRFVSGHTDKLRLKGEARSCRAVGQTKRRGHDDEFEKQFWWDNVSMSRYDPETISLLAPT